MAKGNNLAKIATGLQKLNPVTRVMDTVDGSINNITDYKKAREGAITKRKGIEAEKDVAIVTNAVGMIDHTISETIGGIKIHEVEKTKRTRINAQRDVLIAHLQKARRVAEKLTDKEYEHREKVLGTLFESLNKAIDNPQCPSEVQSKLIDLITARTMDSPIPKIMAAHRKEVDREIETGKIEL